MLPMPQRSAKLVGGTRTGKSHIAVAIARSCIRAGARCRFYTVVDLVSTIRRARVVIQDLDENDPLRDRDYADARRAGSA